MFGQLLVNADVFLRPALANGMLWYPSDPVWGNKEPQMSV